MEENQEPTYRVVRFEVIPQSIKLEGGRLLGKGAREKNLFYGHMNSAVVSGCQQADSPEIHRISGAVPEGLKFKK